MSRMPFVQTLNQTKALTIFASSTLDGVFLNELSALLNHFELRLNPESSYSLRWQAIDNMLEELAKQRLPALAKTLEENRVFINRLPRG